MSKTFTELLEKNAFDSIRVYLEMLENKANLITAKESTMETETQKKSLRDVMSKEDVVSVKKKTLSGNRSLAQLTNQAKMISVDCNPKLNGGMPAINLSRGRQVQLKAKQTGNNVKKKDGTSEENEFRGANIYIVLNWND